MGTDTKGLRPLTTYATRAKTNVQYGRSAVHSYRNKGEPHAKLAQQTQTKHTSPYRRLLHPQQSLSQQSESRQSLIQDEAHRAEKEEGGCHHYHGVHQVGDLEAGQGRPCTPKTPPDALRGPTE